MEHITYEFIDDDSEKMRIMCSMESAFIQEDQARHTQAYYEKVCKNATFLVARDRKEVCGFCAFYDNDMETKCAYITLIAVDSSWQAKGIGRRLVMKTIERACQNGMKMIRLEVAKENFPAISFYEKCGFQRWKDDDNSFLMSRYVFTAKQL